jgi:putative membrane protein
VNAGMNASTDTGSISTELAARRTGMSFQRTRMSAERTLMSVIRTSLSLISFGFTIFQFFKKFNIVGPISADHAPRNFGRALVFIGVGILILGIVYHSQFMLGLRAERRELIAAKLIHGTSGFPISVTLIAALLLLTIGLLAIVDMTLNVSPFG